MGIMIKTKTGEEVTIEPEAQPYIREKNTPIFSFKHFYIEYGRFHKDETNVWIHIVFVPIIVSSMFGIFYCIPQLKHWFVDFSEPGIKKIRLGNFTHMEGNLKSDQ